jgi:hypothetical protein
MCKYERISVTGIKKYEWFYQRIIVAVYQFE